MAQQLPPALLLFALGGWGFVFWGVCARVTAGVLGHWLIGWFAHNQGAMHYEVSNAAVQGRNIRYTSLLTMGESWHNNHHAFPGSARLGLFPGEWDPGWWALMLLQKLGLAWGFRLPATLAARAELQACDGIGAAALARRFATSPALASPALASPADDALGARALIRLCLRGARHDASNYRLEGPSAWLPAQGLRRLVGPRVAFHQVETARRLALRVEDRTVLGLPALCISLSTRNGLTRAIAVVLAPWAAGFERLRESAQSQGM